MAIAKHLTTDNKKLLEIFEQKQLTLDGFASKLRQQQAQLNADRL